MSADHDAPGAGATRAIARWAASVGVEGPPPEVTAHARRMIVDYLAATVAGATTELSGRLREYFSEAEPGERATAILGGRLTATAAAYVNGAAAHGLELDDGYTPGAVHPGAAVIPAVLAVAEAVEAKIDDAARGVAVAVEVTSRIAAAGHPALLNAGFHNTGVVGTFGAAAGVVSVLGGDEQAFADALGLAGSHTAALREYHTAGSEVKRMHAGRAARDGVMCGELALRGVSGPDTILEGSQGFFSAFARRDWRPDVLLAGLGEHWVATRTYVKPYPCCRHLHGPIDAALALRAARSYELDEVERIEVGTFELATRFSKSEPNTFLEAQLSLPFAVAAALSSDTITLESFGPRAIGDPGLRDLARRVTIAVDPVADAAYPASRPATVTVITRDGRRHSHRIEQPLGEPANPISNDQLSEKFRAHAIPVLGEELGELVLAAAWGGDDIRGVTTALGTATIR